VTTRPPYAASSFSYVSNQGRGRETGVSRGGRIGKTVGFPEVQIPGRRTKV
jgi:hypothetical protein